MSGLGMRGKDVRVFCTVARKYNIYILVRQTNQASLNYVGKPGYYPKPAAIKAKTAVNDPPPFACTAHGQTRNVQHKIAGLVPHPEFQPAAYCREKLAKARHFWLETLNVALTAGSNIPATDLRSPATWTYWGKEHASSATGWRWKVDIDPRSQHFGCLQLANGAIGWSYIHGDYDLKDVIVRGRETVNEREVGKLQGVKNFTPLLPGLEFETIRRELNDAMGVEMVQHGAEAQFAGHGDEAITVIFPDGPQPQFKVLLDAESVQRWYIDLNRSLIAKNGKDYLGDRTRWFWFGDHGNLFAPGKDRSR